MAFLCELYASTRIDELALMPWSAQQRKKFLRDQFELQHVHYQKFFPRADFLLVSHLTTPIGRIYIDRSMGDICIVDIALLPAWRGRGIGRALLDEVCEEARAGGRAINLQVELNNPAYRLYIRMGFVCIENRGAYDCLRLASPACVN